MKKIKSIVATHRSSDIMNTLQAGRVRPCRCECVPHEIGLVHSRAGLFVCVLRVLTAQRVHTRLVACVCVRADFDRASLPQKKPAGGKEKKRTSLVDSMMKRVSLK